MPQPPRTRGRSSPPGPLAADAELLALYDRWLRIEIEYPGVRRETLPNLVRFVRPAPGMNRVAYSRLDLTEIDAAIEQQIATFRPMDQPFEWLVAEHDAPPGLQDRLIAHGFSPDDDPSAVMLLDLRDAPPSLLAPVKADVRRLQQREELGAVIRVLEQAVGGSYGWLPRRLGDHMAMPGYLSVVVAYADGLPACCGWIYFHPGNPFAELFGGATVPDRRGAGLYSAVLAARVQEAAQRGVRYVATGASPMSRPILEKNGFRVLSFLHALSWEGPSER